MCVLWTSKNGRLATCYSVEVCRVRALFTVSLDFLLQQMLLHFRAVGDNLYEFVCCLCIDGSILRYEKCVPYKYYVTNQQKPFEFLHGVKTWGGVIVNRCLQVPTERFQIGGVLRLCCTCMYILFFKYVSLTQLLQ